MDICFKALQGETTGRMVTDATTPLAAHPRTDEQRRRDAAPRSSALRVAAAAPYVLGDITELATWFCLGLRSEGRGAEEVFDDAA